MEYLAGIEFLVTVILIVALNTVYRWWREAEAKLTALRREVEEADEPDEDLLVEFINMARQYPNEPVLTLWRMVFDDPGDAKAG